MSDATTPEVFHQALKALLIEHDVQPVRLGPRQTAEGHPADDVEGCSDVTPRTKMTTIHAYFLQPRVVEASAWYAALRALPGVKPYPALQPHPLGGTIVFVRWLDGTPLAPRPTAGGVPYV